MAFFESAQKKILNGLLAFEPVIRFNSIKGFDAEFYGAISEYPKLVYYIDRYSYSYRGTSYELNVTYQNKDVPRREIYEIETLEEGVMKLCEKVSEYAEKIVFVTTNPSEMSRVANLFVEKHGSFYPHFMTVFTQYSTLDNHTYIYEYTIKYRVKVAALDKMEEEVDAEVDRLCSQMFLPGMPNEAKIYLAHNYLATTVDYENKGATDMERTCTQSAYGALIQHHCVCQGFAEAFKRIMDHECISCDVISGVILENGERHAWNIVSLRGGARAHVDTTWDISNSRPNYDYFCKPDSLFAGKRKWEKSHYPKCNTLSYDVIREARKYLYFYKNTLVRKGVSLKVIDC